MNVVLDFVDSSPAARAALGDGYRVEVRVVIWESLECAEGADERAVPPRREVGRVRDGRQAVRGGPSSSWDARRVSPRK